MEGLIPIELRPKLFMVYKKFVLSFSTVEKSVTKYGRTSFEDDPLKGDIIENSTQYDS